jgi:hypothetical protein
MRGKRNSRRCRRFFLVRRRRFANRPRRGAFYYAQFTGTETPGYWHITKFEILSCEPMAGDETEFAAWVTTRIETDGAGFLVGEGIPSDSADLSKGGVCPEVGRQFRVRSLGAERYEIVSVGTGGGTQGLLPVAAAVTYGLARMEHGAAVSAVMPLSGDGRAAGRGDNF